IEVRQTLVQIDLALACLAGEQRLGGAVLPGRNTEVDVTVRAEASLRIQPGDGPSLDQEGLDTMRPEQRDGLSDVALVQGRLHQMEPVSLPKLLGHRRGPVV